MPLEDKCKENQYVYVKSGCFRHNSILYSICLQTKKDSTNNEVKGAEWQGKCSLIYILPSKFLEIQTSVEFENVKNKKIVLLLMFNYHF